MGRVAKQTAERRRAIKAFAARLNDALAARWPEKVGKKKGALWALRKVTGLEMSQLQRWQDGERGYTFVPDDLFAAADALGVHCRWLATGQGPRHIEEGNAGHADRYPNRGAASAFAQACGYAPAAIKHVRDSDPRGAAGFSCETWFDLIKAQDVLTK
jgi:hypothetical protein